MTTHEMVKGQKALRLQPGGGRRHSTNFGKRSSAVIEGEPSRVVLAPRAENVLWVFSCHGGVDDLQLGDRRIDHPHLAFCCEIRPWSFFQERPSLLLQQADLFLPAGKEKSDKWTSGVSLTECIISYARLGCSNIEIGRWVCFLLRVTKRQDATAPGHKNTEPLEGFTTVSTTSVNISNVCAVCLLKRGHANRMLDSGEANVMYAVVV